MACKCGKDDCSCKNDLQYINTDKSSNDLVPDKLAYQTNKRRMAWILLAMMLFTTLATIYDPTRMADAESILMTQYLSMCGLLGAYFGFSAIGNRKMIKANGWDNHEDTFEEKLRRELARETIFVLQDDIIFL